jgi:hypothetical protein
MFSARHNKRTPRRPQATPTIHIQSQAPPIKGRKIKENIGEGKLLQQKSCKRKIEHIVIPKMANNMPSSGTRAPLTGEIPDLIPLNSLVDLH